MPGTPDPIPALKAQLVREILALADQTNFYVAACALGINESRLSDLRRGRGARFSLQRLVRMLANIDRRVTLRVEHPPGSTRVPWVLHAAKRRAHRAARR